MRINKFFILILCILLLCSCKNTKEDINMPEDWGKAAINYIPVSYENDVIISVIDSGCNLKYSNISDCINIINSKNSIDNIGHGTNIIYKINEMIPSAEIIPVRIFDNSTTIETEYLIEGIEKSIELGADVISLSMGIPMDEESLQNVIKKAINNNIAVVAACGNEKRNELLYPAAYDGVFSVMARDISNIDFSTNNKSIYKKSFSAPGINIISNNKVLTGSSYAVPYMTALIAQMKSINKNLSNEDIKDILINSCKFGTEYSYGIIDFSKAVYMAKNKKLGEIKNE